MPYFAGFQMHEGHQFRLDTRIYLRDEEPGDDDHCIAAIIGKNPGSANGKEFGRLAPISLDGDKLLPYVRYRFQNAYDRVSLDISSGAFVRVWNLLYLCNKTLAAAVKAHDGVRRPLVCDTESELPRIVWFAWGPPVTWHRLLPARFRRLQIEHPFYVDMDTKKIVPAIPGPRSRVKHTQGLLAVARSHRESSRAGGAVGRAARPVSGNGARRHGPAGSWGRENSRPRRAAVGPAVGGDRSGGAGRPGAIDRALGLLRGPDRAGDALRAAAATAPRAGAGERWPRPFAWCGRAGVSGGGMR